MPDPLTGELATMPVSEHPETTKGQLYMLLAGVFISLFAALYILRLIVRIWARSQKEKRARAEQNSSHHTVSGSRNSRDAAAIEERAYLSSKGMTQGQIYKFAFLIGLFLTNAGRFIVLIYDWA